MSLGNKARSGVARVDALRNLAVIRSGMAQIVAIKQIEDALLAARDQIVCSVDKNRTTGAQIVVIVVQALKVVGRKPVRHGKACGGA